MNQLVLDLRILMSMTNICWGVLGNGPTLRDLKAALWLRIGSSIILIVIQR